MTIRVGIVGYGNLGRGVEQALTQQADMELAAIFTRRDPAAIGSTAPVLPLAELAAHTGAIDVAVLCGGSRTDLPTQSPQVAALANIVDSFDTHAQVNEHFDAVDAAARAAGTTALISGGWDPGLFSLLRLIGEAALPVGATYTFWGPGLSQGHSDAIRRVPGVADAVQYTIPIDAAVDAVRAGQEPALTTREKHRRECYVVAEPGADSAAIEREIVTMPDYFADYDTTVHFISAAELAARHSGMPHGGFALRSGTTGDGSAHLAEFTLQLGSNPAFTSSVLVACARAVVRLSERGDHGAKTIYDVPPALLSPLGAAELRARLL